MLIDFSAVETQVIPSFLGGEARSTPKCTPTA